MPTQQPSEFDFERKRIQKESAGWEKKGFTKVNPARGVPLGRGKSSPVGGKSELTQMGILYLNKQQIEDLNGHLSKEGSDKENPGSTDHGTDGLSGGEGNS